MLECLWLIYKSIEPRCSVGLNSAVWPGTVAKRGPREMVKCMKARLHACALWLTYAAYTAGTTQKGRKWTHRPHCDRAGRCIVAATPSTVDGAQNRRCIYASHLPQHRCVAGVPSSTRHTLPLPLATRTPHSSATLQSTCRMHALCTTYAGKYWQHRPVHVVHIGRRPRCEVGRQ